MDLVNTIVEKAAQTEKAIAEKAGGSWTVDEITVVGQCRVVNEAGESIGVNVEIGILKDFKTDSPKLITKLDQNEFNKKVKDK